MLDIIIPSYNDLKGLQNSLASFGPFVDSNKVHVHIVDDASTTITKEDYLKLQTQYEYLNPVIYYLPENKGPGYARQYGIDHTTSPYIFCLDCGNVFSSVLIIPTFLDWIRDEPEIAYFGMFYTCEDSKQNFTVCKRISEFHGALLKRQFLLDWNLKIPTQYSYSLEDTSFFFFVFNIAEFLHIYKFQDIMPVVRTYNEQSLTNKEQYDFYFKYLIPGYLYNTLQLYHNVIYPDGFNKRDILLHLLAVLFYFLNSTRNYKLEYFEQYQSDVHLFFEQYIAPLEDTDYDCLFQHIIVQAGLYLDECAQTQTIPDLEVSGFLEWCNMELDISPPERWLKYGGQISDQLRFQCDSFNTSW